MAIRSGGKVSPACLEAPGTPAAKGVPVWLWNRWATPHHPKRAEAAGISNVSKVRLLENFYDRKAEKGNRGRPSAE
jgi:hypothetical protein